MTVLSTHNTVKRFIKLGFKEAQAEALVEAMSEQNNDLATKSQVAMVESNLKAEINGLQYKISNFETKIDSVESKLEAKIDSVESKLEAKIEKLETVIKNDIGWLKAINMAILATVLGIALAPIAQNMFKAPVQEIIPVISSTQ